MATAATSLLGLALPVTGELSGTWGDTVNNSLTALLDTAVAGTTTLNTDADVTLTTTTLASNQARQAIILWTAGGTVTRNITAPAQSKVYVVINASSSTQSIVLRGVGPTTGVTIAQGETAVCAWNGVDFVKVSSNVGSFTSLAYSTTLTGGTGVVNLGSGQFYKDASGNVGIGTTTPTAGYKLNVGSTSAVTTLNGAAITLFTSGGLTSNVGGVLNFRPQLGTTTSDIFNLSICAYDHSGDGNADGMSINGSDGFSFSTGGNSRNERMRITFAGDVGIGMAPTNFGNGYTVLQVANASNGGMLYLTNTSNAGGRIYGNSSGITYEAFSTTYHAFNNNGAERARISAAGGFSVGTASDPGAGGIYATGNITAYFSDDRLKTKLGNIQDALSKVKALSGFYYEANQTAQDLGYKPVREAGVSAQQVQAVMPEVVKPAPIDAQYLTVDYERLVPLLIEAIKELDAKIESLVKA